MKIFISSLSRNTDDELNSYLYLIDSEHNEILSKVHIKSLSETYTISKGFRGLDFFNGKLHIITSDGLLHIYNVKNNKLKLFNIVDLEINRASYIHQIRTDPSGDFLYITVTGFDCLIVLDKNYEVVNLFSLIHEEKYLKSDSDNKWGEDKLHFNSITFSPYGSMCHLYYNLNTVFNYTNKNIICCNKDLLVEPHDIEFIDKDKIVINSSKQRATRLYNITTKEFSTIVEYDEKKLTKNNIGGYTRGLAYSDPYLFIGHSPVYIDRFINGDGWKKINSFCVSDDINEVIYDIRIDKNG